MRINTKPTTTSNVFIQEQVLWLDDLNQLG